MRLSYHMLQSSEEAHTYNFFFYFTMKSITQQLLVIVLCYLQTKESFASQEYSCPQMTLPHMRNTSLWSEFVRSADFINVDETEAVQELVSQISELKAIFNHFKELYVSSCHHFI